jgi:ribosomal protein L34E
MAALIIFRCPHTGMDVQTSLEKQERDPVRAYEAISCPACLRIHFINVITGAVMSQK